MYSSHLCKWMFNLVMQPCPYKCVYICCCSVCNPIAQHTRLISSNRLCYYRSSHTFLITDLFVAYHTHLVKLNRCCSLVSMQTVHPSGPHAVYRTHLDLADRFFVLPNHKQFIRVNHMLYIAHTFIWLPVSFVPPHCKQLIEMNRMPCITHATKI